MAELRSDREWLGEATHLGFCCLCEGEILSHRCFDPALDYVCNTCGDAHRKEAQA